MFIFGTILKFKRIIMSEQTKPVIVPWDFSELAEFALQHAVLLAKKQDLSIVMLHIVKKQSEIAEATTKMQAVVEKCKAEHGLAPEILVKEGSIFTDIGDIIEQTDATFAVMGTHGIKGMQKFTGSWALKVIVTSKAPFIVVQDKPAKSQNYKTIVYPIDFKNSAKENLIWAAYMSKFYGSKIHLCYVDETDVTFKRKISQNIALAQKYLADQNVQYEIIKLEGKKVAEEAVAYAKESGADMILISTTKNISFQDFVLGAHEQKIIVNKEQIPVMCVNPREGLTKLSGFN